MLDRLWLYRNVLLRITINALQWQEMPMDDNINTIFYFAIN